MNKIPPTLWVLMLSASTVFGQRVGQDDIADWQNINIEAAGILVKNGTHRASILVTDSGAVFADPSVVCRGLWVEQYNRAGNITEYISLAFNCAAEWPSQFEYRYTTRDENGTRFDVFRAVGYHRVKLYMLSKDAF